MGDSTTTFGHNMALKTAELRKLFEEIVPDYQNNIDQLITNLSRRWALRHAPFHKDSSQSLKKTAVFNIYFPKTILNFQNFFIFAKCFCKMFVMIFIQSAFFNALLFAFSPLLVTKFTKLKKNLENLQKCLENNNLQLQFFLTLIARTLRMLYFLMVSTG